MRILRIDPGKSPEILNIDDSLESMQSIVDGMIQAVYPFDDSVALIVNEEGKILGMEPNRALRDPQTGTPYDIVFGTMFLCGAPADSDCFADLTEEQLSYYQEYYREPELFLQTEAGIVVLRL
jgi:hypothetical protein